VAADTARALARRGHELTVVAPTRPGRPAHESVDGIELHRVTRRGRLPQTFADPVETWRAVRALGVGTFDVAVAHQATNGAALARLGIPIAAVFHASAVLEQRFARVHANAAARAVGYALDPALVALERSWLHGARTILVLSRFSAGLLDGRHPALEDRVRVVGGGVDRAFFEPARVAPDVLRARLGIPSGTLLFTARRLEQRMGVDRLIEALARLDDARVVLAVAGDGALRPDLEALVTVRGLAGRVRLLGRVSEEDLRGLYAAADLFVLPTVAYEGFGMSTVEALAQGTPALGTAVGATPEILEALGPEHVVPSAEPDVLAVGIARLLPRLGPDLRARARALAEHSYHWDAAVVRWEEAIAEAAGR
jgi:glycosyltransferase involved in cell wall biosynthesis